MKVNANPKVKEMATRKVGKPHLEKVEKPPGPLKKKAENLPDP